VAALRIPEAAIRAAAERETRELERREVLYRGGGLLRRFMATP
jgi:predicted phosphoribosyltransferase